METLVFGQEYASIYDDLYETKDYDAECDFLEALFARYHLSVINILDLGCGTGGHVLPLAQRGYQVVGVDRSPYMLECARKKLHAASLNAEFVQGDIGNLDLNRQFDVVISMFAVMGYQTTNDMMAAACRTARKHLNDSGAFIFDVWYGPGVLADRPKQCLKRVRSGEQELIRFTEPILDTFSHTVDTRLTWWLTDGAQIVSYKEEAHLMRFFFPQELSYFLEIAGFQQIHLYPFLKMHETVDDSIWNITVIGCLT
jgi:SAM-dependent methyltransferase